MLRLTADENFNNDIMRGLLRRKPDLDLYSALLEKGLNCGIIGAPTFWSRCSYDHSIG